jgi:hypothetical protein
MDANGIAEMVSFGRAHFGGCDLGDKRLTERVVQTADLFLQHPGGTLPDKLNRNADLMGLVKSKIVCKCSGRSHAAANRSRTFFPIA